MFKTVNVDSLCVLLICSAFLQLHFDFYSYFIVVSLWGWCSDSPHPRLHPVLFHLITFCWQLSFVFVASQSLVIFLFIFFLLPLLVIMPTCDPIKLEFTYKGNSHVALDKLILSGRCYHQSNRVVFPPDAFIPLHSHLCICTRQPLRCTSHLPLA